MKFKLTVDATYEGQPVNLDMSIEFEKEEYIEVIKTWPEIVKQVRKELKNAKN